MHVTLCSLTKLLSKVLIYTVKEAFYTENKIARAFQWLENNTDYILIIF